MWRWQTAVAVVPVLGFCFALVGFIKTGSALDRMLGQKNLRLAYALHDQLTEWLYRVFIGFLTSMVGLLALVLVLRG